MALNVTRSDGSKEIIELVTTKKSGYTYLKAGTKYALLSPNDATDVNNKSHLWVKIGSNSARYVLKRQTFTVNITQSANQTITVTCNGVARTASFTATYGDTYTVSIIPAANYNAGSLNITSGSLTADVAISATSATLAVPSGHVTVSFGHSWTVPEGVNRIKYKLTSDKYISVNSGDVIRVDYTSMENPYTDVYLNSKWIAGTNGNRVLEIYYGPDINT